MKLLLIQSPNFISFYAKIHKVALPPQSITSPKRHFLVLIIADLFSDEPNTNKNNPHGPSHQSLRLCGSPRGPVTVPKAALPDNAHSRA